MLSSLDSQTTTYYPLTPRSISIALKTVQQNQLPTHSTYYLTYYNILITITFHFTYSKTFVCNVLTPTYVTHTIHTFFRIHWHSRSKSAHFFSLGHAPKLITTAITLVWNSFNESQRKNVTFGPTVLCLVHIIHCMSIVETRLFERNLHLIFILPKFLWMEKPVIYCDFGVGTQEGVHTGVSYTGQVWLISDVLVMG